MPFINSAGNKTDQISLQPPPRGPHERDATEKQKSYLLDLGVNDPAALENLGIKQASVLIEQLLAAQRAHRAKKASSNLGRISLWLFLLSMPSCVLGGATDVSGIVALGVLFLCASIVVGVLKLIRHGLS